MLRIKWISVSEMIEFTMGEFQLTCDECGHRWSEMMKPTVGMVRLRKVNCPKCGHEFGAEIGFGMVAMDDDRDEFTLDVH
jgi:DNA-directed RNA polymerase subunit RPC12/RpoP